VSWYGNEPYHRMADETVLIRKGWKWDVLAEHFRAFPNWLRDYDYFWLPDDDIDASAETIDQIFDLSRQFELEISQPALTLDSYFSFPHLLRCSSFQLRYSSFIEVMAPCLSRTAVERSIDLWPETPSGFGLDMIWTRLERDNSMRAAIIDACPVRHTRPVGRFLKPQMEAAGRSGDADAERLMARFPGHTTIRQFYCYAGISRAGRIRGPVSTGLHMLKDMIAQRREINAPRLGDFLAGCFKYILLRPNLGQLKEVPASGSLAVDVAPAGPAGNLAPTTDSSAVEKGPDG